MSDRYQIHDVVFDVVNRIAPSRSEQNLRMGVLRGVTALLLLTAPFQAWPAWTTARVLGIVYAYLSVSLIGLGLWQARRADRHSSKPTRVKSRGRPA